MKGYVLAWPFIALGVMLFVGGVGALVGGASQMWSFLPLENQAAVQLGTILSSLGAGFVVLGTLAFPKRDRHNSPPTCSNCGYNLTGNVSGVCPECGTPCQPAPRGPAASAGRTDQPSRPPA
jgi:hypothetical protein